MCAGTPTAAEGSYRSRNGFTNDSASGTNPINADSIGDMRRPFLHLPALHCALHLPDELC
jgi:hypothetical protein